MPLSHTRDAARKRLERASKAVQPNSNLNPVQPVQPDHHWRPNKYFPQPDKP